MMVCTYSSVSRSPVLVVDMRAQKVKADNKLSLPHKGTDTLEVKKVAARCYSRPILWQWPRHKDKNSTSATKL